MDEIIKQLQSPGWWFNIIIVVILGGVAVGFLKDAVARWLSRALDWKRQRKAATLSRQELEIEFLLEEPTLLTLHYIHAAVSYLLFFSSFVGFLLIPVWTDSMFASPPSSNVLGLPVIDRHTWNLLMDVPTLILGVICGFWGFYSSSRLTVSLRAYRLLYIRRLDGFVDRKSNLKA